jgi:hypothetical protein
MLVSATFQISPSIDTVPRIVEAIEFIERILCHSEGIENESLRWPEIQMYLHDANLNELIVVDTIAMMTNSSPHGNISAVSNQKSSTHM